MSGMPSLNQKYQLTKQIGAGAFGEVYIATDLTLRREVAVKLLKPLPDPSYTERFLNEARLTSQLTHSNTLTIYDFGQHEERLYLVSELLRGESLRERLNRCLRLSPHEIIRLFIPVCSALEEAHQAGVIHRDLKPDNLFLHQSFDGERLVLLDFGIAKSLTDVTLTQTGQVFGTPHYMAPEQIRESRDVAAPADLYSLGVILYECLVGTQPYHGASLYDVFQAHITAPIPSLAEREEPGLSLFDELISAMLAKDPKARPQSARELGVQLMALERKLGELSAPREGLDSTPGATLDATLDATPAPQLALDATIDATPAPLSAQPVAQPSAAVIEATPKVTQSDHPQTSRSWAPLLVNALIAVCSAISVALYFTTRQEERGLNLEPRSELNEAQPLAELSPQLSLDMGPSAQPSAPKPTAEISAPLSPQASEMKRKLEPNSGLNLQPEPKPKARAKLKSKLKPKPQTAKTHKKTRAQASSSERQRSRPRTRRARLGGLKLKLSPKK